MRNSSLTLLKFGIISLVSLHWVACVWALLPTLQHERHGWTGDPDSTHLAGRGDRPLALYVQSFEYAITTMVMDQARAQPTNTFEQGVWLVVALVMGALYAYIIGVISAVVTNMDPATTEFNAISDLLDSYMRELGLDEETADRARRYLTATELHFRQDYYRKLLAMLSPGAEGRLRAAALRRLGPPDLVSAFNRMECIVRVGERADAMYIVRRGIVGVRGVPFSCGKFFGEEMIRDGQWRDYSAICATFSDLHVLHKEDLRAILAGEPVPADAVHDPVAAPGAAPIDFPKMRKIRTLHKEGSNAFHEELRTAHGIDAKDLDGSQVRADTDAFQSVCEPERDGGAVTRREVEELLVDLERRLKGEAPATSTSPVTALSDSPRRTAAAVDFEIADLRRKLEELEQARDRLSREDMSGGAVRRLSMVGNA
ncbi:phosphorelay sensor kinase [Aureococcus anophagefferens]|nr:phosphorelay sensor kinase [Aureococcus anophagefferens]